MGSSTMGLVAALTAVLLWSTNAYAADLALGRMSVGWLLMVQYATAAVALLAICWAHRIRGERRSSTPCSQLIEPEVGRSQPVGVLIGVVGLTGTIFLQYLAFATAPIVAANVLAYAWPLLATVWVAATRRSRAALFSAGLAVVGFGGVALIFTSSSEASDAGTGGAATWGYLAALGSAACMAVYTVGASRHAATTTTVLIPATITGTVAAAALTVLSDSPSPSGTGILAAVYIGLGPMAAGYALWTRAMAGDGAERLSPLGYATPLLSTVLLLATGAAATTSTVTGVGLVLACSLGVLVQDRYAEPARTGSDGGVRAGSRDGGRS